MGDDVTGGFVEENATAVTDDLAGAVNVVVGDGVLAGIRAGV